MENRNITYQKLPIQRINNGQVIYRFRLSLPETINFDTINPGASFPFTDLATANATLASLQTIRPATVGVFDFTTGVGYLDIPLQATDTVIYRRVGSMNREAEPTDDFYGGAVEYFVESKRPYIPLACVKVQKQGDTSFTATVRPFLGNGAVEAELKFGHPNVMTYFALWQSMYGLTPQDLACVAPGLWVPPGRQLLVANGTFNEAHFSNNATYTYYMLVAQMFENDPVRVAGFVG